MLDKKFDVDGGDSCAHTCQYFALLSLMKPEDRIKYPFHHDVYFLYVLNKLQPVDGVVIRHPDPTSWTSDWDRGSTDQCRNYVVAAALRNDKIHLRKFIRGHALRGFLFFHNTRGNGDTKQNHGTKVYSTPEPKFDYRWKIPDLSGMDTIALFIRGSDCWELYWALWLLDFFDFVGSIVDRLDKNKTDVRTGALIRRYGLKKWPTPWLWLAEKIMPPKIVLRRLKRYFAGDGNLVFFVKMFADAYRNR
jgi:hypothetical protein